MSTSKINLLEAVKETFQFLNENKSDALSKTRIFRYTLEELNGMLYAFRAGEIREEIIKRYIQWAENDFNNAITEYNPRDNRFVNIQKIYYMFMKEYCTTLAANQERMRNKQLTETKIEKGAESTNLWSDISEQLKKLTREKYNVMQKLQDVTKERDSLLEQLKDITNEKYYVTEELKNVAKERDELKEELEQLQSKQTTTKESQEVTEEMKDDRKPIEGSNIAATKEMNKLVTETKIETLKSNNAAAKLKQLFKQGQDIETQIKNMSKERDYLSEQLTNMSLERNIVAEQLLGMSKKREIIAEQLGNMSKENQHLSIELRSKLIEHMNYITEERLDISTQLKNMSIERDHISEKIKNISKIITHYRNKIKQPKEGTVSKEK